MLHFVKLIKFPVLFRLASSNQSEIADSLKSNSLRRYNENPRLKAVTKTFQKKVQHKSTKC